MAAGLAVACAAKKHCLDTQKFLCLFSIGIPQTSRLLFSLLDVKRNNGGFSTCYHLAGNFESFFYREFRHICLKLNIPFANHRYSPRVKLRNSFRQSHRLSRRKSCLFVYVYQFRFISLLTCLQNLSSVFFYSTSPCNNLFIPKGRSVLCNKLQSSPNIFVLV